jgi:hypothetical protein
MGEDGRATVLTARWGTYGGSPALLGDKRWSSRGRPQRDLRQSNSCASENEAANCENI